MFILKCTCEFDDVVLGFVLIVTGLLVGPIASSVLILGNVAVILGMFPPHVSWTVYTLVK